MNTADVLPMAVSLIVGVVAGFVAAITAGAGVIAIPALVFLGLPANQAIATNALSIFGMLFSALPQYYKANSLRLNIGLKLIPLAITGGFIGSRALTHVDVDALSVIVGVLLMLLIPVVLLSSDKGIKNFHPGPKRLILGYAVFFSVMAYGGFLGAAAGIFSMYTLIFFFGLTYIEGKATTSLASFFLSATALTVFIVHGLVNLKLGIPMMIGMYLGGAWGAKTALEKGNAWVRIIFIGVAAASSIKLLFFR